MKTWNFLSINNIILCSISFLVGLPCQIRGQTTGAIDYKKTASIIVDNINGVKNANAIQFSSEMNKDVEKYGYNEFLGYYHNKFGMISACEPSAILPNNARFQITAEKGRWSMVVRFSPDGSVSTLEFLDPEPIIPLPERNITPMRLPFRGEWSVDMGGPTLQQNYHVGGDRSIRRAVDFVMRDAEGKSFKGDWTKNENHFSFGKDVLAVADGVVVTVIEGVPDNRPLAFNPLSSSGNTVILKHANYEFSRYFHLRMGSVCVKVGQKVVSGQIIAQCGNSGYSAGSHLHFDLTNTDVASDATGFAPYFQDVILRRNGTRTQQTDYTPLQYDFIQSRESK